MTSINLPKLHPEILRKLTTTHVYFKRLLKFGETVADAFLTTSQNFGQFTPLTIVLLNKQVDNSRQLLIGLMTCGT